MASPQDIIQAIREVYGEKEAFMPLHAPQFGGNEARYVQSTIDSTFVSSVGKFVDQFEDMLREITGARHAIATVNGTAALHMTMLLAGVQPGELVITQSLSFAATTAAIAHAGAIPVFIDVDRDTLGMSPDALRDWLQAESDIVAGQCIHRASGKRIAACVPMHTFGLPCRIDAIAALCKASGLVLVEDAAEALGSYQADGRHCGNVGQLSTLSFNGNKVCTTGGGGAILSNDPELGKRGKHLTTTAKVPHAWRFFHDAVGYNYRLPNLNAALGCAQLERLPEFIAAKRLLAGQYAERFEAMGVPFIREPAGTRSNYWLCAILMPGFDAREALLEASNAAGVMTRPVWEPLHTLPIYAGSPCGPLPVTTEIAARLVNIPSSPRL